MGFFFFHFPQKVARGATCGVFFPLGGAKRRHMGKHSKFQSAHIELPVRPYKLAPYTLLLGVKIPQFTGAQTSRGEVKTPEAPDLRQPQV